MSENGIVHETLNTEWENEGTDFCLVIVARCQCADLLVIRPGFNSRQKFVFLIPS